MECDQQALIWTDIHTAAFFRLIRTGANRQIHTGFNVGAHKMRGATPVSYGTRSAVELDDDWVRVHRNRLWAAAALQRRNCGPTVWLMRALTFQRKRPSVSRYPDGALHL